jgi:hypothetical protein
MFIHMFRVQALACIYQTSNLKIEL